LLLRGEQIEDLPQERGEPLEFGFHALLALGQLTHLHQEVEVTVLGWRTHRTSHRTCLETATCIDVRDSGYATLGMAVTPKVMPAPGRVWP
jgi:hypothetical protein